MTDIAKFSQDELAELGAIWEAVQAGLQPLPIMRHHWPVYRRAVYSHLIIWEYAQPYWSRHFRQARLTEKGKLFCAEHSTTLKAALERALELDYEGVKG